MKREKLDRLGEILQESVNKHEIAGGNLLVMHHGEEIYYAQAGMADIAQGKGIERDSLFRLYSMSKPVTSAAVMLLMERGIVDLLDPISKYIPSFAESMVATGHGDEKAVRQVTVKDCLSMTSGLVYNCDPDPASKDTAVVYEELDKRLYSDNPMSTLEFADKLEKATLGTIESGKMTKDLALITSMENVTVLNSENFIKAIRENLEKMM